MGFHKDLQDFGRGFMRLWERIHVDLQDFVREDSWDFGRGFMGIREDLQGERIFTRWERICETFGEDLHFQGFARLWERILGEDSFGDS